MWSKIFKERIRLEGIEQKEIIKIMGINESGYYKAIKNNSMKTQNILKVYNHFDWDMNELKGNGKEKLKKNVTNKNVFLSEEIFDSEVENLREFYEGEIKELTDYTKKLQDHLNILLINSQLSIKLKKDINSEIEN